MNTPEIPHFMGTRVQRREDPALLTGAGTYTGDIHLEDMLHLAIVRSPYGHAEIRDVDTSQAEALEGVVAVLTAEDVNPHLAHPFPAPYMSKKYSVRRAPERYPLAAGRVRHVGDPVAVVLAEDGYTVADAADLVFVDYDPLPVVMDPEAALGKEAPVIYEEWGDNVGFRRRDADDDVDPIFADAAHVVECRTVNQRVIGNAMEPRAVVAEFDADGDSFTVWTPTQRPHSIRDGIADMLSMPEEKVRVIAPNVGGGFGIKASFYPEEVLVPLLARQFERPVKWMASRSEDYLASVQGRGQITTVRLAADAEGRVQAVDLDVLMDCGAYYGHVTPYIPTYTTLMIAGVYTVPAVRSEFTGVVTNKQASEPYRGAGRPEGILAIERAMDCLAAEMGLDPVDLRRRNFIPPDAFPYETPTGAVYDSGRYEEALDKALDFVDYQGLRDEQARRREAGGKLLGVGVACYIEVCGFGPFEMGSVFMDEKANVTILSGTSPQGQGHETAWTQIAAGVLQVPPESITVKQSDTAVVPRGIGTFGSRSAAVGGNAIFTNAETVRDKARKIAGHLLEAAAEDVVLDDGRFHVAGVPDRSLSWKEIAQAAAVSDDLPPELQGGLSADEDFKPEGNLYPFGTHICVVEVDPETGDVEVVRYVTVDDCGNVINPMLVSGQVHGGIAQGIGQALLEGAHFDEMGNLLTGTLLDYAVPRADTLPAYETHRTETPSPLNPMGVKGVGEAGTIGATSAVVNAVMDALSHLGVGNLEMPFTAEKIWRAINSV
ncbi:MAG: xanthine dehydrogenase family protein molybdopterin-binding subunit [Candidatus Promineifilaceae bacterium]|nr:xanthine dehydrogenase family protein molybdopterin-binding subunit [Candidatus Promineifilaceae bacterium]